MSTLNRVFLMGNLTRDPEVRYTPSGTAVGDIGLAVNETYKNKAGETVESAVFVDIEVWARQAETCAEYLYKGSSVLVEGRLKLDQWENQQGEKRPEQYRAGTTEQAVPRLFEGGTDLEGHQRAVSTSGEKSVVSVW